MKCYLLLISFLFVSCASNEPVHKGKWRKSPAAWVNGAEVYSNVEALEGRGIIEKDKLVYMASTQNFDGPLRWQIVAEGTHGEHVSMRVKGIQVSTSKTKRSLRIPNALLGADIPFVLEELPKPKRSFKRKSKEELEKAEQELAREPRWMASFTLSEILQLYPKADGRVVVAVNVEITTAKGSQSEWVNFALLPNRNRSQSFTFRQTMVEYGGVPIE